MNIIKRLLLSCQLLNIGYQLVTGTSNRKFNWHQNGADVDRSYSPSLLTTIEDSLAICLVVCSVTVTCKAATYNNGTGECSCLDSKTSVTSQPGNTLWDRQFDGFIYSKLLRWYIRIFENILATQAEAESICGSLGARLVVLDTKVKFEYVIQLTYYTESSRFYVGATDKQTEGAFIWNNGAVVANNWGQNEPNSADGDEDCMVLERSKFFMAYGYIAQKLS